MLPDGYIENYEQIAEDYKDIIFHEMLSISQLIMFYLKFLPFSIIPKEKKVIDIGCGNGFALDQINRKILNNDFKAGIDISYNQCGYAKTWYKLKTVQADAQLLPIKNESFFFAICIDVFEHVPDEKLLIDEIYRILQKDGILFFACPLEQDLSYYDKPEYERKYRYVHLRSVNRELLEKRFERFKLISEQFVTSHMKIQRSPYPIIFQIYRKE